MARARQGCASVQAGLSGAVNMAAPGLGVADGGSGSNRLGKSGLGTAEEGRR